jgi:adenine-specific DNA-methyltransferase
MDIIETLQSNTQVTVEHETESSDYIANYIGSKQKLLDWTWDKTPKEINSVFDAFSGAATLSYMYKAKGMRVISNDRLHYCYHIARAIIENNYTYLKENDIDLLLRPNHNAGTFIRDTFKGLYFGKGVHSLIDQFRANCDLFYGYKRDLALFALGTTCISSTCGFGNFTSTSSNNKPLCIPSEFKERFRLNLQKVNSLVFDNGKPNKALMMDINDVLPFIRTDLVFFDAPYVTEFSVIDYEKAYHFVEGLMTYWKGLTIKTDSKLKCYETSNEPLTKNNIYDFFSNLFRRAGHYPYWIISYRDHAFPTEKEMKDIITSFNRTCNIVSNHYHYSLSGKNTPASNSIEYLFICKKKDNAFLNLPLQPSMKVVLPKPYRLHNGKGEKHN